MERTEFQIEEIDGKLQCIVADIDVSLTDASTAATWDSTIWHLLSAKAEAKLLLKAIVSKINEAKEYRVVEEVNNE